MLFNLQSDTGSTVQLYLVPDGYNKKPRIRIENDGIELLVMDSNELLPSLLAAGRHETGYCGFRLDETILPGLSEMTGLEVTDFETQMPLYRRPLPGIIERKIVRVELGLLPHWRLDRDVALHFQYSATSIERFGLETITQMFLLDHVSSEYISGRLQYRNFVSYIEAQFETIAIVQDPYDDLAERLLGLSRLSEVNGHINDRDMLMFRSAIQFAQELAKDDPLITDERKLRDALRTIDHETAATLSNSVVRQLTCPTPRELPSRQAVATALNVLSGCTIVGLRDQLQTFTDALGDSLNLRMNALTSTPQPHAIKALGEKLRKIGEAEALISVDLELYHHILAAAQTASETPVMPVPLAAEEPIQ